MNKETFHQALIELYQGEIIGEVIFDKMLSSFEGTDEKYKVSVMLQLETETKARLRPTLMQLGIDIAESEDARQAGLDAAASMSGKSWSETMFALGELVKPYVERYKIIAAQAPETFREIAQSMVVHEQSLYDFTQQELSGDPSNSLDRIIDQIVHKPPVQK